LNKGITYLKFYRYPIRHIGSSRAASIRSLVSGGVRFCIYRSFKICECRRFNCSIHDIARKDSNNKPIRYDPAEEDLNTAIKKQRN